jgi:4,5-DOPA dioxygenase extradiol
VAGGTAHLPPIFVSHGAVGASFDTDLASWARALPRPAGVLVVSARWQAETLSRGSTAAQPAFVDPIANGPTWRAPGAPSLAYELATLLPLTRTERGWDYGVWGPLARMYPEADLPVLQLSLVAGASPRRLFGIGRKLGVLAARGYLIVGSGNVTHNAGEIDPRKDAPPVEWARAFDAWLANLLADAEMEELFSWRTKAPDARRAHPTTEHIDPLFVVAGAASLYEHAVGFPIRGFEHGTLSRRCIQFGR